MSKLRLLGLKIDIVNLKPKAQNGEGKKSLAICATFPLTLPNIASALNPFEV